MEDFGEVFYNAFFASLFCSPTDCDLESLSVSFERSRINVVIIINCFFNYRLDSTI